MLVPVQLKQYGLEVYFLPGPVDRAVCEEVCLIFIPDTLLIDITVEFRFEGIVILSENNTHGVVVITFLFIKREPDTAVFIRFKLSRCSGDILAFGIIVRALDYGRFNILYRIAGIAAEHIEHG